MIPGIDPKVDIAFKKLFCSPAWLDLTVALINAVLQPAATACVVDLELKNPYSQQISPDDKLTILDVKAQDDQGRQFDVEMQMELVPQLPQRLLFYWARMYAEQLAVGDNYTALRPAISICFLNQCLFPGHTQLHHVFRLADASGQLCLTRQFELHVIEIPKFTLDLDSLRTALDFWLYFLKNGTELDADALPAPLARSVIQRAMEVLKVYSQDELDRDLYENRLKGQRDHQAFILARDQAEHERDKAFEERDEAKQHATHAVQERDQAVQHAAETQQQLAEAEQELKQQLSRQIQLCQ